MSNYLVIKYYFIKNNNILLRTNSSVNWDLKSIWYNWYKIDYIIFMINSQINYLLKLDIYVAITAINFIYKLYFFLEYSKNNKKIFFKKSKIYYFKSLNIIYF